MKNTALLLILLVVSAPAFAAAPAAPVQFQARSERNGKWSDANTWAERRAPKTGDNVQIRAGDRVVYDVNSDATVRVLHVAGTLSFTRDKSTRLGVGLIKIAAGDSITEDGFNCHEVPDLPASTPTDARPALEIGTADEPIPAGVAAVIQLVHFEGMDAKALPAIVNCGGRWDTHGAPLNRTWVKLGATAKAGDAEVKLGEPITGWRVGDRVIVTASKGKERSSTFRQSAKKHQTVSTEERLVTGITGSTLILDRALENEHFGTGDYRSEVANLSRNVVIESAAPDGVRGHTMFHRGCSGGISYAEFRHLGKQGVLGKYSLHFHLVRDTMRGTSVIGASIWDSGNRWITIHGSNYLVVRDCVGYRSVGHGFFLEDGTEVYNVLDRNLAVQAYAGKALPNQVLPFDTNDGAGFWWANSLNTFTRNTAAECDEYGFRFEATPTREFSLTLPVAQPDGSRKPVDVRTLPFVRFEDNESHCQRRHALNLGGLNPTLKGDVGGVGPDAQHPFVLRNTKIWNVHWAFHPMSPSVLVDGMDIHHAEYALWRAVYERHAYRGVRTNDISVNGNFSPQGTQPREADFPGELKLVDDLPPATVITRVEQKDANTLLVRGTTSDNGTVKRVVVNGVEARSLAANFGEWEATLKNSKLGETISARAEDVAGNEEKQPHALRR